MDARQLRNLLDTLGVGVCLLDREAVIRYSNRALTDIFEYEAEALVGKPIAEVFPEIAHEVDWARAATSAIDRGRTLRLAEHALPNGVWVDCALVPIALDGGDPTHGLLTMTDVTETVRLEEVEVRQARTQAIANLGDSIAHEIRNPLNSIGMNVQLLREGLNADSPDRERLERTASIVQREIKRLDGVVRDFVQYSRPPALRLERGSVNHVVRAALDLLDAQLREKNIQVETDLQSARPVRMDRDRLQRAFYNVLLNAVQVLPEGGAIVCRSRDEERRCLVEISDDGPGLDTAQSVHIFEVFYTTKAGGTGLGLPIANRIVEEHGGRMAVASAPDQGATFAFFLPYEGPPAAGDRGPTTVPKGSST